MKAGLLRFQVKQFEYNTLRIARYIFESDKLKRGSEIYSDSVIKPYRDELAAEMRSFDAYSSVINDISYTSKLTEISCRVSVTTHVALFIPRQTGPNASSRNHITLLRVKVTYGIELCFPIRYSYPSTIQDVPKDINSKEKFTAKLSKNLKMTFFSKI